MRRRRSSGMAGDARRTLRGTMVASTASAGHHDLQAAVAPGHRVAVEAGERLMARMLEERVRLLRVSGRRGSLQQEREQEQWADHWSVESRRIRMRGRMPLTRALRPRMNFRIFSPSIGSSLLQQPAEQALVLRRQHDLRRQRIEYAGRDTVLG